jgi:hypothetical protein
MEVSYERCFERKFDVRAAQTTAAEKPNTFRLHGPPSGGRFLWRKYLYKSLRQQLRGPLSGQLFGDLYPELSGENAVSAREKRQ